jgi:Universal stress protein family
VKIEIYSPDSLIVGTRGRDGAIGGLLPGSMSKYCLQHSPVPVIVVHPSQRRLHRKNKRQNDPDRQSYLHLLKLAKLQNPSEEVLPTPIPTPKSSTPVPDITFETHESVSPGDPELVTASSSPAVTFRPDLGAATLHHATSDPGHPSSPSPPPVIAGAPVVAALEKERENLSPGSKG